ncbi:isoaspartyl peptidase/L-asparaginase [Blastopirellula sp. J2-11]|uniref:isoaspartyl peptidase/L-asparaginase n=1 Tax=Blastopirellula sp. J2-11 TaxID=2943192 RepID=UPI0021CA185E|nr:isoaspartyl peptidase/L-asparaginase [Blastopirellula sp. J2-11]UUO06972.1 isoaspartyl peptidase/L-asparaginase [Blastopirellula sp. J2-11]
MSTTNLQKTIASANGLEATRLAYHQMTTGSSPLDAAVAGVTLLEDDPDELTVGYGGLPDGSGEVTLDAAVMDGPQHRGGSVIGLKNVRHAAQVARLVMQQTRRAMLCGDGALEFARANGFVEENLLTEKARQIWLYWKRLECRGKDWLPPQPGEFDAETIAEFERYYPITGEKASGGTVHLAARDAGSDLACATTTSGHCFKMPGRVGDSPIFGAGLYVDNNMGTCGSVGHGEANLLNCSSFQAVYQMGRGASPIDAGLETLAMIAQHAAAHERDDAGKIAFNLQLFLLHKDGRHAGVAIRGAKQIAVTDGDGTRLEACVNL